MNCNNVPLGDGWSAGYRWSNNDESEYYYKDYYMRVIGNRLYVTNENIRHSLKWRYWYVDYLSCPRTVEKTGGRQ